MPYCEFCGEPIPRGFGTLCGYCEQDMEAREQGRQQEAEYVRSQYEEAMAREYDEYIEAEKRAYYEETQQKSPDGNVWSVWHESLSPDTFSELWPTEAEARANADYLNKRIAPACPYHVAILDWKWKAEEESHD